MFQAQDRKFKRQTKPRMITRILAIFSLVAAGVLVFAIAPGLASSDASRAERRNHRVRMPAAAAAVNAAATATFPVPFAAIDVDRTDDTAAASACTAAPNDCSLRGAVAS